MGDNTDGILTQKQREFLTGEFEYEGEYARQQRYDMRKRIQKRVSAAMGDFSILLAHFDDLPEGIDDEGLSDAVAFFVASYLWHDSDETLEERQEKIADKSPGQYATAGDHIGFLEFILESSVNRGAEAVKYNLRYNVSIEPRDQDSRSIGEFVQAIRAGELSRDQFEELYRGGRINRDKFVQVMAEVGE